MDFEGLLDRYTSHSTKLSTTSGMEAKKKLRVGFVHPDLGIGGAERLVVDAAVSLQKLDHEVFIFTSRHDPERCFEETGKKGVLNVEVLGSSLPQRLPSPLPPMTILFSLLRSILLSCLLISSSWMPGPASFVNPLSPLRHFDVFFVDQQSVCVPLLRFFLGTRVVFYCHFPDKLLSGGWEVDLDNEGEGDVKVGVKGRGLARRIYRWPVDTLEEWTTGQSDVILSNSNFTARVYARSFPSLAKRKPKVVYPCIDVSAYKAVDRKGKGKESSAIDPGVRLITSERPTLISLNRYEAKKNIHLAIRSFAQVRDSSHDLRLVIAGGYDDSLQDNLQTLVSLRSLAESLGLTHHTVSSSTSAPPDPRVHILFILNFSTAQRTHLLTYSSTIALLYTPANEHFGIVPVEAMACGLPVLAANSGGPTESIIDLDIGFSGTVKIGNEAGTGLLRSPNTEEWAPALRALLALSPSQRERIRQTGVDRVAENFSSETLGREVEEACYKALAMGDLHGQIGDKLIWGGAALMGFAALNLGAILLWYGLPVLPA